MRLQHPNLGERVMGWLVTGLFRLARACAWGTATFGRLAIWVWTRLPDRCSRCHGKRGGVRGNENVVDGVVLCDYCHCDDVLRARSGLQ